MVIIASACLGLSRLSDCSGVQPELHIHSPKGLEELFSPLLAFFCKNMSYRVVFHEFATKEPSVIYEDRSVAVTTIPLQHLHSLLWLFIC